MCGHQSVPWSAVRDIVFRVTGHLPIVDDELLLHRQKMIYALCKGEGLKFFTNLLSETTHCLCSDPRDKIFALLSLTELTEKRIKINPDYTKSIYDVYQDFMVQFITIGHVRLLRGVEMHEHLEGVPSWVPDWSTPRLSESLQVFNANAEFNHVVQFQQGGILQVSGVLVTAIERTEALNLSISEAAKLSPQPCILELQRVVSQIGFQDEHLHSKEKLRELCQTLCTDQVSDRYYPSTPKYPTRRSSEESLTELLNLRINSEYIGVKQEALKFMSGLLRFCEGRSLFRSTQGRSGLGPKTARAGDIVTVVLGVSNGLVLRPTNDHKFQVVGEAYYNDIMNGQALLGPLPDGIEEVSRYSPSVQQWHFAYFDRDNNTVMTVDPRVRDDLPPGWSIEIDPEDEIFRWFVSEETGKRTWRDPRLTLELLKKRGVDLQVFDLI
jgi:hypothetical protein